MVVDAGVTDVEPETATAPIPGEMVTALVLVVVQVRTAVSPASIEDLLTLKKLITGGLGGTGSNPGISGA